MNVEYFASQNAENSQDEKSAEELRLKVQRRVREAVDREAKRDDYQVLARFLDDEMPHLRSSSHQNSRSRGSLPLFPIAEEDELPKKRTSTANFPQKRNLSNGNRQKFQLNVWPKKMPPPLRGGILETASPKTEGQKFQQIIDKRVRDSRNIHIEEPESGLASSEGECDDEFVSCEENDHNYVSVDAKDEPGFAAENRELRQNAATFENEVGSADKKRYSLSQKHKYDIIEEKDECKKEEEENPKPTEFLTNESKNKNTNKIVDEREEIMIRESKGKLNEPESEEEGRAFPADFPRKIMQIVAAKRGHVANPSLAADLHRFELRAKGARLNDPFSPANPLKDRPKYVAVPKSQCLDFLKDFMRKTNPQSLLENRRQKSFENSSQKSEKKTQNAKNSDNKRGTGQNRKSRKLQPSVARKGEDAISLPDVLKGVNKKWVGWGEVAFSTGLVKKVFDKQL